MLKFRYLIRKEVVEVNDERKLLPMQRIIYGIMTALSERDIAKLRRQEEQEKEFIRRTELIKNSVLFVKTKCLKIFREYTGGKVIIYLDRHCESVIPQIMKSKDLKGYEITVGKVDTILLKTRKDTKIPLIVRDKI